MFGEECFYISFIQWAAATITRVHTKMITEFQSLLIAAEIQRVNAMRRSLFLQIEQSARIAILLEANECI